MVLNKMKERMNCSSYRGIALVAHAEKVFLKVVVKRHIDDSKTEDILPDGQCGFRSWRSTMDMTATNIYVILHTLSIKAWGLFANNLK